MSHSNKKDGGRLAKPGNPLSLDGRGLIACPEFVECLPELAEGISVIAPNPFVIARHPELKRGMPDVAISLARF